MKKFWLILLVLSIMIFIVGCDSKDNSGDVSGDTIDFGEIETYDVPDAKIELDDFETVSLGEIETYDVPNAKIEFDGFETVTFGDFEVYDNVSGATINFNIEEFKLNNIDNFDEADIAKIDNFTESELQVIVTTKVNMLNKLTVAFNNAGINVDINETSGEISLDSSVLFGGDSAVLSSEGKDFLNKFITAYTSVVFSDEFDGFISKILVEGHTAPVPGDTYESGLPLSEERADNVKNYCLSNETGISQSMADELSDSLESVGLSNSKPVTDSSGNVDMAASRRVSFRFLINVD